MQNIQLVLLKEIHPSATHSQIERRRRFDEKALSELAESIKSLGMLSPIIVRHRWKKGTLQSEGYELVAGERRWLAAAKAKLEKVPVHVRELTDKQVLEVQLIENLQREGLHELAEAEGYEGLQKLGHGVEEIAAKVGKSKAYVYARMKLLALSKMARAAFYGDKLNASTALLLARIPDEKLQLQALKEITADRWNGPMSYRAAAEHIQNNYMLRLSDAGFKTEDPDLVPAAGTCGACPKRTGNQKELFGDVKGAHVCTDPICFKAKRQAHAARAIAQAKESGVQVITGKEVKRIAPYGSRSSLQGGFVKLSEKCYDDKKQRTYGQLLGNAFEPALIVDPESHEVIKVAPPAAVKEAMKAAGISDRGRSSSSGGNPQAAAEKKAKLEMKFRAALYGEIRGKLPEHLGPEDLRTIALRFYQEMQSETQKRVMALWRLEPVKKGYSLDTEGPVKQLLGEATDEDLVRFFFDLVFVPDLQVYSYHSDKPERLLSVAKKLGVDAERIRKDLAAAATPKAKKKAKGK